ncbi:response regulator transcription factor [bacterium AH-315-K03]|nr:response regulator transcription factor [bacterium AH-315-K03]
MPSNTPTILLVDDDESFTQVLSRALQRHHYQIFIAHNIESAIALAKQHSIDRAIVDLKMQGPSGLTVISELKRLCPEIDIVMLTGYSSVATAVEAIKLGAQNYLCKPATTQEILAAFTQLEGNSTLEIPDNRPSVDRLEWEHIQKVLNEHDGNISATARALGMHRRTLQRKLNKRPVKK